MLVGDMRDPDDWIGVLTLEEYKDYKKDKENGTPWKHFDSYDAWMKRVSERD